MKDKVINYILIEGQSKYQLQSEVQSRLDMGFEPIGGIVIEVGEGGGFSPSTTTFHQAMILRGS